jgi:SAM-dependent methyltransferase
VDEAVFDAKGLFDEDYLYFSAARLTDNYSDTETQLIWELCELAPGMEVLDLACGHGRIANRLAARGCQVTGLDATPLFLDRARRDAEDRGVSVDYVESDMRGLRWTERFDRVISWFTAFGYFDDDGCRQVLAQVARAVRPGGRFVLDLNNRDWIMREFRPFDVIERDGDLLIDQRRIESLTGRIVTHRTVVRDGRTRRIPFFVRLFTYTELRDWLLTAGFTQIEGYGQDGAPLSPASRRLVVVGHR